MRLHMSLPLFLGAGDHDYNAALRLFGSPSMFASDLRLPAMPLNAVGESNWEILVRLGDDLTLINDDQLSALDSYRFFGYDEMKRPFWGYGVESARARVGSGEEIIVLMRSDDQTNIDKALCWMPLGKLYTRKQARLVHQVLDTEGPTEGAMHEILELFRDVFECAVETSWTYEKRLEFYHSFPFEELSTREAVLDFRPVLLGCAAFADFEFKFPECE
eukprot:CAMPEP_0172425022 /NCGR_PEP_ID=MMETSP1064-20121228/29634_1 /TAXON_ID=202472 /ORGANISM="Aulacoseira subarctica , Strain CCAP 1002/5" /LENGTH=217 /DNA_ID=CAMNT_0013167585 /DNA_START=68 /DNA_END=721 /DNA_ORIENTATION=+